jgi:hypothetical protein
MGSTHMRKIKRFMRLHFPHIVSLQEPLQLLCRDRDGFVLKMPGPREPLLAFDHLVPNNEDVFIKPLFRMSLIDRESPVSSLLSWGASA